MIKITIPNNNIAERKYILDVIFDEFLGLDYKVEGRGEKEEGNWEIELENGNKLIVEDHFFNIYPDDLEYLKLENIPTKVEFAQNEFIVENDIPIIYGTSTFNLQPSTLTCGIDIFASSFFMLTRWEEYVNKNRDKHNRFFALESLAYKNNFLDRPVVNEYLEMLKNMLLELGLNQKPKTRNYELLLTHDVDAPLKYRALKDGAREIAGDIIKRRNLILAVKNSINKLAVHIGLRKDPFDTFDYLMDISEKAGVKSYFFFMGKGTSNFDNMYKSSDKFIKDLINKIKQRGHNIGIHPTYNAYNDFEQIKKEKQELETNLNTKITFGREHFLRFEVPTTWQIWEDNGLLWDSTLSFADKEGFRCGVCYPYSVFNILTRKKLNLKERPLIVMEGSFVTYQPDISPKDMEEKINLLIDRVKKYNGEFVFLWHNSSFNTTQWEEFQGIYERVVFK
jgi:hypothetical protein